MCHSRVKLNTSIDTIENDDDAKGILVYTDCVSKSNTTAHILYIRALRICDMDPPNLIVHNYI